MKHFLKAFKKRSEAVEYVYDRSSIVHQYQVEQRSAALTFWAAIIGTMLGLYGISLL